MPPSPLRRDEPVRLPVLDALERCPAQALLAADDDGKPVAVARLADGSTVILPDTCPHDGGLLSDGFVEGQRIVCARHGWEFDGRTGECLQRPGVSVPCAMLAEGSGPVDS